jgi:hypothetical protein
LNRQRPAGIFGAADTKPRTLLVDLKTQRNGPRWPNGKGRHNEGKGGETKTKRKNKKKKKKPNVKINFFKKTPNKTKKQQHKTAN